MLADDVDFDASGKAVKMDNYLETKGRIFDIQRFSVHDGQGIRTIVFLKGCVLRCKWCCNPESQSYAIENLTMAGKTKLCGRDVTVREVMEEVTKDFHYYRRSGGGLTLSGGEALCQPDFAIALLKAAKENGLTTAIESTGYADVEMISKVLEYLDCYLMDIKHINEEKHKAFTGKSNRKILENAQYIAKNAKELVIRVPVIPTFNDTPEEIAQIANFVSTLPNVKKMHLLPYHRFGVDKYSGLGRQYELENIVTPSDEHMNVLLQIVSRYGIKCQIGG